MEKGKNIMKMVIYFFEGEYLNDLRHGNGKECYNNKKIHFNGEYLYGRKWNIKEYDVEGNVINEIKNGKEFMKEFHDNDKLYSESEYLFGLINGNGKEYYENGKLSFEGEYLNDFKNGKGKIYNNEGIFIFEGEFFNDNIIKGKEYIKGNLVYEGKY